VGFQSNFSLNFSGVDGVAAVMTGTILDVGDLVYVGLAIGARTEFIKYGTQRTDNFKVGFFIPAADVVGFT
jgi:hypothetical protein